MQRKHYENYASMEENVLACYLIKPEYLEGTVLETKHFKKYAQIFSFFKECYQIYGNLDISIIFSCIKGNSEQQLVEIVERLLDIFVIPTHYKSYEHRLLNSYKISKRDEWLKKRYNEEINKLNLGVMSIDEFKDKINDIYAESNKYNWR